MIKFLGITTIEAFAAAALGMAVGAVTKDVDAALAIGPSIMTVFILFSGKRTLSHVGRASPWHTYAFSFISLHGYDKALEAYAIRSFIGMLPSTYASKYDFFLYVIN